MRKSRRYAAAVCVCAATVAFLGYAVQADVLQVPTGTWAAGGPFGEIPQDAASAVLVDGRLVVAGGSASDGQPSAQIAIYNPASGEWTIAGNMSEARAGHTATALADGRVLIAGGRTSSGVTASAELYDPATGASTAARPLSLPRAAHAAARLLDGRVLIVGGTDGNAALARAEMFDPETGSIAPLSASLSTPRMKLSATTLLDGHVLVAGGNDGAQDLATTEMFYAEYGVFLPTSSMSAQRSGHVAVLLPNNNSVLIAGGSSNGTPLASVERFAHWFESEMFYPDANAMAAARTGALAVPTPREGVVLVGGGGSADAELYGFATVKTDKDDYAPYETVTISGGGWQPGETVHLRVTEDSDSHYDWELEAIADEFGNIINTDFYPREDDTYHHFGMRFYMMAQGIASEAQTTFTDGNKVTFSTSASGIEVTDFGTATANQCVNAYVQERQGNNIDNGNHPARNVSLSSAPAGAAFFAGLNCATSNTVVTIPLNKPAIAFSFKFANPSATQYTINGDAGLSGSNDPSATVTFPDQKTDQAITVTQGAPTTATFGSTFNVAATASSVLPVTITATGSCSGGDTDGGATITMTSGAGTCTVHYNQAGNTTYKAAPEVTSNTTAAKANATINVSPYTATYNGSSHTATGTATGVNGEDLAALLDLSGTTHTNAGNYAADPWTFAGDTDYNSTNGTVADTITPANATIEVQGYSGAYDGTAHGATGTAKGVLNETLVGLDLGASFTNVPGGTAHWVFTDVTGNYNNAEGSIAITISRADATIDVQGYSGAYDGMAHGATGTAKGVLNETLGGLDLGASFTNVPGGTAHWVFTDVTGNYNNAEGSIAITISKADATIDVQGYSGAYDGTAHGATGTAKGVLNETLSGLDLGASFTNVPGGTAHWVFTDVTGNYNNAEGSIAITISKADATIDVQGYSGAYDGTAHGATGTAKGVLNETLGGLDLGASFTNVPGGTAHWVFADVTGNYNNAEGSIAITISKANATIDVQGYSGVYDAAAHGATGSAKGVLNETLGGLDLGASFTNVPGGTAHWVFTDVTGNYNNAEGSIAITITPANATIDVHGYSAAYDGTAHGATGSAKGVLNETLGGLDLGASFTNVPGGTAHWVFTDVTGNYNNAEGNIAITISKATATVVVTPYSVTYDGQPHTAAVTSITGVNGETGATVGSVNVSATTHTNPGNYTSDTWSFTGTANYNDIAKTITDTIKYGDCSPGYGPGGVILQPINSDGTSVYSRKGGSTIPVKFAVCDASGMPISNHAAVFAGAGGTLTMLSAVRGTVDLINETGISDIPDAGFRWAGDKWIFNMGTSNLVAGTTYTFRINLAVGFVQFKVGVK